MVDPGAHVDVSAVKLGVLDLCCRGLKQSGILRSSLKYDRSTFIFSRMSSNVPHIVLQY